MSYIFLSFSSRLDSTSIYDKDFYNLSLRDQFDNLKKRLPLEKQYSLEKFIGACFPSGLQKKYFISCPNFLREKKSLKDGATFLNNVVIRPEFTIGMSKFLPDNQNVILIGNILYEGQKFKQFIVKGIEFIDISMASPNDKVVEASACTKFEKTRSIRNVNYDETIFTPDFINDLILNCYTVNNPASVRKVYDEWNKYIDFRKHYLAEQSKRHFKLDSIRCIDSYAISRKEYKTNSNYYEDFLLDNNNEFKKSDMVILSQNVANTEPFPLIRLDIDRNLKAFNEAKVIKKGNEVNEEEIAIRLLSRDNVFITSLNPNDTRKNGKNIGLREFLMEGYILGDRFRFLVSNVLPTEHLEQIDFEYKSKIEKVKETINSKYEKIVRDELDKDTNTFKHEQEEFINKELQNKRAEFDASLDKDVQENIDNNILQLINADKKKIKQEIISKIEQQKNENYKDYQARLDNIINEEYKKIDIKQYYIDRNITRLESFKSKLLQKLNNDINDFRKEKESELKNKYKKDLINECSNAEYKLNQECLDKKKKVEEDETIKRFSIYFKPNEQTNNLTEKLKEKIEQCKYIVYDSRAEQAIVKRQETALENFYSGYVKNPYLLTYLFSCKELPTIPTQERENRIWYLESLNEQQKEAVRKAVNSNAIFLLQGPPGTGKTQVIAETVAHLVKQGKKVLISSQTHKAIDNVFERLPKIPEIVPVRLITTNVKKQESNEFDPTYLVDNFYQNISSNLKKSIERFENFEKNKSDFRENFECLKLIKFKVDKAKKEKDELDKEIAVLESKSKQIKNQNKNIYDDILVYKEKIDRLKRTKRYLEKNRLTLDDDIEKDYIHNFKNETYNLFLDKTTYTELDSLHIEDALNNIFKLTDTKIEEELELINPNSKKINLEIRRDQLRKEFKKYVDEFGEVINLADQDKVREIKNEIIKINNELKKSDNEGIPFSDLILYSIYNINYVLNNKNEIKRTTKSLQRTIYEIKNNFFSYLDKDINDNESKLNEYESKNEQANIQLKRIDQEIIEIEERSEYQEIQKNENELRTKINNFFKEFEISEPYKDENNALLIIENKRKEIERNYSKIESENKEKIPMYTKISNYLSNEDVIENDRKSYTKDLFDNANVFGITCSASDRFNSDNINSFGEFGLDNLDIKSVGIDVVIIDEVSKSSFIDLLIPILYGKTIILVGDHRQLPPLYEFRNLKEDDFKALNEDIINPSINKRFTEMYEMCIFKKLFEEIGEDYKTMLVKQYRCHEQIMRVFNHFYQNQLQLGFVNQNNVKQHNIKIHSNGRNIIDSSKHVYFVDCKKVFETHEQDSTSIYNSGEADVVISFIKKINTFLKNNPNTEKLTIGVICTYGDQAKIIRNKIKNEKIKTDGFDTSIERMIVSTVDDFQGDERDIIILSMVRNPEYPNKSNPGFILAYQRINVALSRARKLLIIVGNRKYLENKGVIDLPDINGRGNDKRGFRVYEEIISTIEEVGKVIDDIDVLDDKENVING